jgi:RNA polymerase subunit RPABC4/transcription elongation factor Spt4
MNGLVACKVCEREIAKTAKQCPNCGAKMSKSIFKRWWFWLLIVIVLIAIANSGGDSKKSDSTEPAPSATVSKAPDKEPTKAPEAPKEKVFNVGDSFDVGKLSITVVGVQEQKEIKSNNSYIESVKTEGKFIVVDAKIVNNDSESRTLDTSMFKVIDTGNREFDVISKAEVMMIIGDKYLFLETLNPGLSRTGTLVFEVPADVTAYSLKTYPGVWFKTGKPVTVKLK